MNQLDKLYAKFAKEDEDPIKALATTIVNGKPISEVPTKTRNKVENIIKERRLAIIQTIMWS